MITGIISAADHLSAMKLHRAKYLRRLLLVYGIVALVGIGIFLAYQHRYAFMVIGAAVGAAIGELIHAALFFPRKMRRLYGQRKFSEHPVTYAWDSECFEVKSDNGYAKTAWNDFVTCKENDGLFLLYVSDNLFQMIPKSWFQNEAQLEEFRACAKLAGQGSGA